MFNITVSIANGLAVVGLTGAMLRGHGSDHLTEVVEWLRESGERRIALHAAGVSAVDLDGLVALMDCHSAMAGVGGCLVIKMPSRPLRLALRRTGLDTVLKIVDGPELDPSPRSGPAA
jgi:anti-anti-sigma regulatory factor